MSAANRLLWAVTICFAMVSAALGFQGTKEKIVFVRADPSVGVVAQRIITDTDSFGGGVTGGHAAPELNAQAANNARTNEIELMNPDGSEVTRLRVYGSDPMLSPDGAKIAYCSQRDSIYWQIYVMNADGSSPKRLTDVKTGDACGPAWSKDGKHIAYHAFAQTNPSRNPEIWVMEPDGSNPKKLTDHGQEPSWSPDGKQLVFASHRDGLFQIYAINADGTGVRRLTKSNSESSNPAWAPDGSIAFSAATGDDRRGLFVMNPDGSDVQGLVHSKHQDFCFPSWSLDGKLLIFSALTRVGSQGIVQGEEKPRCEQWSGEYQLFAMDGELKTHLIADAKVMGTRPSYGRVAATH